MTEKKARLERFNKKRFGLAAALIVWMITAVVTSVATSYYDNHNVKVWDWDYAIYLSLLWQLAPNLLIASVALARKKFQFVKGLFIFLIFPITLLCLIYWFFRNFTLNIPA